MIFRPRNGRKFYKLHKVNKLETAAQMLSVSVAFMVNANRRANVKTLLIAAAAVAVNVTPIPHHSPVVKAMCVAVQSCQTCYGQDPVTGRLTSYTCNCSMHCLPGTG